MGAPPIMRAWNILDPRAIFPQGTSARFSEAEDIVTAADHRQRSSSSDEGCVRLDILLSVAIPAFIKHRVKLINGSMRRKIFFKSS